MKQRVQEIVNRLHLSVFGKNFKVLVETDKEFENGRIYLQVLYDAPCTITGNIEEWKGRKFYLSQYMTDDEIVQSAYVAFEADVKHEVMEGFKVDGIILCNPHINFEELLKISHKEVKRQ